MENKFSKHNKIGEIAAKFPKATDLFMKYGIDFCCGGDRQLKEALEAQNIDLAKFMEELNESYYNFLNKKREDKDWTQVSMTELIDHVVNTHHTFMKNELPIISELLNKVLKAHYQGHGELLTKVHRLFTQLKGEIEEHLIKEEEALFPLIKKYEMRPAEDTLKEAIKVMNETEDEHEAAGDILKELRRITTGYQIPEDGCMTFQRTYEKLEQVEVDLFQHIHLENNILFVTLLNQA